MVIRRPKQDATHAALGYHRKRSLRSLGCDGSAAVELTKMLGEEVVDRLLTGGPEGAVEFGLEEFGGLLRLCLELHAVAIGKLDDESCQFEEWIGLGA